MDWIPFGNDVTVLNAILQMPIMQLQKGSCAGLLNAEPDEEIHVFIQSVATWT